MTRLVIHIGDCKAGSTAIQSVLRDQTYTLSGGTVPKLLYPRAGRRAGLNHHRLSNSLHLKKAAAWREKAWTRLRNEIEQKAPDIAIISSERFEFTDPNILRKTLNTYFKGDEIDLHILCYVRPHLQRLISGYAQNLKQGIFDTDVSGFIEAMEREGRFRYAPRPLQWASVFEDATVSIKPLIRSELRDGCVVSDCLNEALAGFEATAKVETIPQANASLSVPALDFLRTLWSEVEERNGPKAAALNQLCQTLEERPIFGGPKLALTADEAERAKALYLADARACDVQIFGRPALVPALHADAAGQSREDNGPTPDVDSLTISRVWLDVMAKALERSKKRKGPKSSTAHGWASIKREAD